MSYHVTEEIIKSDWEIYQNNTDRTGDIAIKFVKVNNMTAIAAEGIPEEGIDSIVLLMDADADIMVGGATYRYDTGELVKMLESMPGIQKLK